MVKIKKYWWIPIWILIILGILTLLPYQTNKPNLIGYFSIDPNAPISSIILWIAALICYIIAKETTKRYKLP